MSNLVAQGSASDTGSSSSSDRGNPNDRAVAIKRDSTRHKVTAVVYEAAVKQEATSVRENQRTSTRTDLEVLSSVDFIITTSECRV